MPNPEPPHSSSGPSGRWVVAIIVGTALVLGWVGVKFRQFKPRPAIPTTSPVGDAHTQPMPH